MNSDVPYSYVLLQNQRHQDYTRGKALVSLRSSSLSAGGALGEPCGQVPTTCRQFSSIDSLSEGTVAEQIFGSNSQDPLSMYPCPLSSGSGSDVQGDKDKWLCQMCAMSPTQQLATCTYHVPMNFSRKKRNLLLHVVTLNPRQGHTAQPRFSSHSIYFRGPWKNRKCLCKDKV